MPKRESVVENRGVPCQPDPPIDEERQLSGFVSRNNDPPIMPCIF